MFSLDRWLEVLDTIRRNKLRTALTMISVAWGIFVLVFLLGLGRGMDAGLRHAFRREATNGIWISANKTSVPFGGYDVGRKLVFDNRDYDRALKVPGVEHLAGQYYIKGGQFGGGEMKTLRGAKSNVFDVRAMHPAGYYLTGIAIDEGRFLDDGDMQHKRKSVVIGRPVRDFLFRSPRIEGGVDDGTGPVADPIGQWIVIGGVPFEVVGVFSKEGSEEDERAMYIPVSTAQLAFHGQDHLGMLELTVGNANSAESKAISDKIVAELAEHHNFAPTDPQAALVHSNIEGFERFSQLFFMIATFVVVIGLGTLAAGVVGVSNIMMIAVKERTKEIGVRKALGATPGSIIAMIIQEAVFLTSIAGLAGLSLGVALLGIVDSAVDSDFMRHPSIDLRIGLLAALGLILAGALAGYIPARAAAKVNPIHALRDQ